MWQDYDCICRFEFSRHFTCRFAQVFCSSVAQVGHTYSRIDQTFRTLIRHMRSAPIYTVGAMVQSIAKYLTAYKSLGAHELHCVWGWTEFLEQFMHEKFAGFDTSQYGPGMHEFMIRKDVHGVVRLWVRASSQSSDWLPEGEGMPIFKSEPIGHPELRDAKPDSRWRREMVESTVNGWFQYMAVDGSLLTAIRQDWASRFSCLPPPDGDISQIPAAQKLEWIDLPTRTPGTFAPPAAVGGDGLSLGLENPAVNPMTFHGRTATDREQELATYQREVLAHNARAVFQAQHLFVKGVSGKVELQRVANGVCIADAEAEDIVFSTAVMEHHPQDGWDGFWGWFAPKPNALHDPNKSKSGTKFVRQQNVSRADILVYNVQVWSAPAPEGHPTKTVVRVKPESLDALALVSTEQPPVPADESELPETHGGGASRTSGETRRGGDPPARGGGRARASGRARGRGRARGAGRGRGRAAAARDDDDDEADDADGGASGGSAQSAQNSDAQNSDADASNPASDEDPPASDEEDPPPPIPEGWETVDFGQPFARFLLWTSISIAVEQQRNKKQRQRNVPPAWHDMLVVKELGANRRDGLTHDAHLFGEDPGRKRGVCLSKEWHQNGCWVGIKEVSAAPAPAPIAPAPAPIAPAPAPTAKKRGAGSAASGRSRKQKPPSTPPARGSKRARNSPSLFHNYQQPSA